MIVLFAILIKRDPPVPVFRERVTRTKVNSVAFPADYRLPFDYTRFVGARNRSSDRCRVKEGKEEGE